MTSRHLREKWVALAAVANGEIIPFSTVLSKFSLQVIRTLGTTPTWTALLQGSLDGENWVTLLTITDVDPAGETKSIVDKPMLAARIRISAVTGTPTLNAFGVATD